MTSSTKKVKILLVGSVTDKISILSKKLTTLNNSKAGPFDICFCSGPIQYDPPSAGGGDSESAAAATDDNKDLQFPIPVYITDRDSIPPPPDEKTTTKDSSSPPNDSDGIVTLGPNVFLLKGGSQQDSGSSSLSIFDIPVKGKDSLIVGTCPRHARYNNESDKSNGQRQQCDLLFSGDWPQGMEDVLQVETEPMSYDVAQIALECCRPRYHICPSTQYYHTSPPFYIPNTSSDSNDNDEAVIGRFIALAPVTTEKKPSKTTKYIHALGLEPLKSNPSPTTATSILPCPYLSGETTTRNPDTKSNTHHTSTTTIKKKLPGFVAEGSSRDGNQGFSRFATTNRQGKRSRSNNNNDQDDSQQPHSLEPPDDPTIATLFLYGLHRDVTGELQSTKSSKVLLAFSKYNASTVRHPPNTDTTTYCFIEFPSQKEALDCILDCQGKITIDGVDLQLKWAQQQSNHNNNRDPNRDNNHQQHKKQRREPTVVTHDEAKDSTTLYYHIPEQLSRQVDQREHDDSSIVESFAERLRQFIQSTLEDTLNDGDSSSERVTAETEPALRVSVRTKDKYGFLEFASHAAATMALAAVTKSTDGGSVVVGAIQGSSAFGGTTLRWAKGEQQQQSSHSHPKKGKRQRDEVLEALGVKRQYFPADTRTDCWFCLASPSCETHLITGVFNEFYTAMPKGPCHEGHVLIVPVTHTSDGAWSLSNEWINLVEKLQKHASQVYDMDLFVFERCMATKGGYHTHIQCVPVPRNVTTGKIQSAMLAHAKASGFDLRPIESDLGAKALISKDDAYFYAEIRKSTDCQRFLYRKDPDSDSSPRIPIQFAREVLASVLDNQKLAHWKSCVVDKEKETELATAFRNSFNAM